MIHEPNRTIRRIESRREERRGDEWGVWAAILAESDAYFFILFYFIIFIFIFLLGL